MEETRIVRGQAYRLVGERPYTCRDGREIMLDIWESECAQCGEPMRVSTTPGTKYLNRRCAIHKRPGTPTRRNEERMDE